MGKDVIIALDFPGGAEALGFLDRFTGQKPYVKVGMELFYGAGAGLVRELKARGHRVFLDLKLHDIPHTVERAMAVLSGLNVDMCNVHAAGTMEMMKAALRGLTGPGGKRPLLIAVTQLTSTSRETMETELLIKETMEQVVARYAQNAAAAGLDGVVCSPWEAAAIHRSCGAGFLAVTPGIRFAGDPGDDQARIATPARAGQLGSDYIVVGRPITKAGDPEAAYQRCLTEFTQRRTV